MNDATKPSDARAERLTAALRANLRKRKAQARASRDEVPAADPDNMAGSDYTPDQ